MADRNAYRLGVLLVALLTLLAGSTAALSQSTASIQGVVTDPSGAVVPGAQVIIHNQAIGRIHSI